MSPRTVMVAVVPLRVVMAFSWGAPFRGLSSTPDKRVDDDGRGPGARDGGNARLP